MSAAGRPGGANSAPAGGGAAAQTQGWGRSFVGPRIAQITVRAVRVTRKTVWLFVEVLDSECATGIGEATPPGEASVVIAAVEALVPRLLDCSADPSLRLQWPHVPRTRAGAAAASAIDHALWDLAGQRAGAPVATLLGATERQVALYANINRGLTDRSPAAFATGARAAVDAGFTAVKIAPFDDVDVSGRWGTVLPATRAGLDAGLARIAATRAAVGSEVRLMVDCHWRFDEKCAESVIDAVTALHPHWIECPLPEEAEWLPALKRLRARANARAMRLAGGEDGVGREAFLPFLTHGAYDVLMPDMKYVGGFAEMQAVAALASKHGVAISPHNPTGPVAHAASLHACTVLPGFDRLELQFNETPLFERLVQPALPAPLHGIASIPERAGLGVHLVAEVVAKHQIATRNWHTGSPAPGRGGTA